MEMQMKTKIAKKVTAADIKRVTRGNSPEKIKGRIAKFEERMKKSSARAERILEKNKERMGKITELKKRLASL
jgi:hypothetical protein